jgi:hypothetical protein
MTIRRGDQGEYNRILDAYNGRSKNFQECVYHLIGLGYSYSRAQNAVHVYFKGGATRATFTLFGDERDKLLDDYNATKKPPKECVNYLMSLGCTYRQATSAVYTYRQKRGIIGK